MTKLWAAARVPPGSKTKIERCGGGDDTVIVRSVVFSGHDTVVAESNFSGSNHGSWTRSSAGKMKSTQNLETQNMSSLMIEGVRVLVNISLTSRSARTVTSSFGFSVAAQTNSTMAEDLL